MHGNMNVSNIFASFLNKDYIYLKPLVNSCTKFLCTYLKLNFFALSTLSKSLFFISLLHKAIVNVILMLENNRFATRSPYFYRTEEPLTLIEGQRIFNVRHLMSVFSS